MTDMDSTIGAPAALRSVAHDLHTDFDGILGEETVYQVALAPEPSLPGATGSARGRLAGRRFGQRDVQGPRSTGSAGRHWTP
jgi:hypothetical protein